MEVNLKNLTEWAIDVENIAGYIYRKSCSLSPTGEVPSPEVKRQIDELSNRVGGYRSTLNNLYYSFPEVKTAVEEYNAK